MKKIIIMVLLAISILSVTGITYTMQNANAQVSGTQAVIAGCLFRSLDSTILTFTCNVWYESLLLPPPTNTVRAAITVNVAVPTTTQQEINALVTEIQNYATQTLGIPAPATANIIIVPS